MVSWWWEDVVVELLVRSCYVRELLVGELQEKKKMRVGEGEE